MSRVTRATGGAVDPEGVAEGVKGGVDPEGVAVGVKGGVDPEGGRSSGKHASRS